MKKLLRNYRLIAGLFAIGCLIMTLWAAASVSSAASDMTWTIQFGTGAQDHGHSAAVDVEGNIYVTGYNHGQWPGETAFGNDDAFIRKFDKNGSVLWTRQFGTDGSDFGADLTVDELQNVYVVGYTTGAFQGESSSGLGDGFVRKYSPEGVEVWTDQIGSQRGLYDVEVDGDGYVYVLGESLLRKYDENGIEVWSRTVGNGGLVMDESNNVLVGSATAVKKYSPIGDLIWSAPLTCLINPIGGIAHDVDGSIYVVGETTCDVPSGQASQFDALIYKLDSNGVQIWSRQVGTTDRDMLFSVATALGDIFVVGYTRGVLPGQTASGEMGFDDAVVRSYDGDGNERWTSQFGTSASDAAFGGCDGPGWVRLCRRFCRGHLATRPAVIRKPR